MRARARGLFAGMLPAAVAVVAIVSGAPPGEGAASPGVISTQVGGPGRGLVHNVAQEANWVATGPDGSVYVSDVQGVVRQFNDTSTWEKAIAGLGQVIGYGGDRGLATRARLGLLGGLALDQDQNVLVADTSNNRVRMIAATSGTFYGIAMTAGDIYTVAGTGTGGFAGDGGLATAAELSGPEAVAVDGSGNLVISDSGNERIRVVAATSGTFYGIAMTAGRHLHRGRQRQVRLRRGPRPGDRGRAGRSPGGDRRRIREPGHRRQLRQPDPGGRSHLRHLLRHAMTAGRHLHRGRHRHRGLRRRRRPGHRRGAVLPERDRRGRRGEPGHRRFLQQPDPGDRGHLGHLLRAGHDRRATSTPWPAPARPATPATAARPPPPTWAFPRRSRWTGRGTWSSACPTPSGCGWWRSSPARSTTRP